MRLMAGVLAAQPFRSSLVGDASLSRRPMGRVVRPLRQRGAVITGQPHPTKPGDLVAPLVLGPLAGGARLSELEYRPPMSSAQVKSSLLLAGLYARGMTCVTEPAPTRDHTERMLAGMGYPLQRTGARVCLEGGHALHAIDIDVPADISSAAFFLVGASIAPGSDLLLEHVGMNPTRTGVIDILQRMVASIEFASERDVGGERVADLREHAAGLRGIAVEAAAALVVDPAALARSADEAGLFVVGFRANS